MSDDHVKNRPSDSSEVIEENITYTQVDEDEDENDPAVKSRKADEAYMNDLEELEKARKEHEARKKEELEKARMDRHRREKGEDENEGEEGDEERGGGPSAQNTRRVEGQAISRPQKEFSTEKKLFRHNKMFGFAGRGEENIDRALRKAHLKTDKRKELIQALEAYNPSKSLLKKKDFDLFARKFRSRNFGGTRFQQASKSIDFKSLRKEFSKRELNKFRRAVTGESDPNKYQTKTEFTKAGKPDRHASSSKH